LSSNITLLLLLVMSHGNTGTINMQYLHVYHGNVNLAATLKSYVNI